MGYRSDVVVAYTAPGWDDLVKKIGSNLLSDSQRREVIAFLDEADEHAVNEDGDHCLRWDSIKFYADDVQILFTTLHNKMEPADWRAVILGEEGDSEEYGDWFDNPFNIYVSRMLNMDTTDDESWSSSGITFTPTPSAPTMAAPINDHTCVCGNTACSKTEKSCWKCGAPIS